MVTALIEFKPEIHQWALDFSIWNDGRAEMSKERAGDLARQCTELVRRGNDFPKVWSILLKSHVLVDGMPRQRLERNRSLLDIPLITGEQLVFDADVKEFRIQ
jgi:hypothetical protein